MLHKLRGGRSENSLKNCFETGSQKRKIRFRQMIITDVPERRESMSKNECKRKHQKYPGIVVHFDCPRNLYWEICRKEHHQQHM